MTEITPEYLADIQCPDGIRISPDGKHVVYTVRLRWSRKEKTTSTLWIAEVGRANSARQLTSGNSHDTSPRFSPDGRYISFLSDRDCPGKQASIYLLRVRHYGEAVGVTPKENKKEINDHQWSYDSKCIAYTSADEKSKEQREKEKAGDDAKVYGEDWEYHRLRVVEVKTQEVETVVSLDEHVSTFCWSPDGQWLAYTMLKTPHLEHSYYPAAICTVKRSDQSKRRLTLFHSRVDDLLWYGDDLLWIGKHAERPLQTSYSVWRRPAHPQDCALERVAHGTNDCARGLRRCGEKIIVYVQRGLTDELVVLGADKVLFAEDIDISKGWDVGIRDDRTTVATVQGVNLSSAEAYTTTEHITTQLSQHCSPSPDLIDQTITLRTKAEDGTSSTGVLYIPSYLDVHESSQSFPAVVMIRGGPYSRVTKGQDVVFSVSTWLLALGYVVLHVNYRGGSGQGAAYAEQAAGDPAGSYEDVIALLRRCIRDGLIDETRVAIAGGSQGGYLSYLAVTRDETFHFAAAVPFAGVSDWDAMVMTSDVPTMEADLAGNSPWLSTMDETAVRKASPLWHMHNIRTPVLILHGEDDVRVPVTQAIAFHRGLLAKNKTSEMVVYPREGHGFPVPFERTHYIHMLRKIEAFLKKHMRVRPGSIGPVG